MFKPQNEMYGRSPLVDALPEIKAWNALPIEVRAKASARFVERQMLKQQIADYVDSLLDLRDSKIAE